MKQILCGSKFAGCMAGDRQWQVIGRNSHTVIGYFYRFLSSVFHFNGDAAGSSIDSIFQKLFNN